MLPMWQSLSVHAPRNSVRRPKVQREIASGFPVILREYRGIVLPVLVVVDSAASEAERYVAGERKFWKSLDLGSRDVGEEYLPVKNLGEQLENSRLTRNELTAEV